MASILRTRGVFLRPRGPSLWATAVPEEPTRKKIRAATVAVSARVVLCLEEEGLRVATVVKKRVPSGGRIIQILIGEEGKAQQDNTHRSLICQSRIKKTTGV